MPMMLDWTIVLIIPAFLLSLYAQFRVKSTYHKWAQVGSRRGLTGAQVAALILRDSGIQHVDDARGIDGPACSIEAYPGQLTDHYDPRTRTLRLSEPVYNGRDLAALGVAAHEVGHAIQHARRYYPLVLRQSMYPLSSIGSNLGMMLFFAGFFFTSFPQLMTIGIALFSLAVFFTLVTLPVEFDASRRALVALEGGGYLERDEIVGARKVLNAAALTYVAAALMAVLELLRLIIIANSRRD